MVVAFFGGVVWFSELVWLVLLLYYGCFAVVLLLCCGSADAAFFLSSPVFKYNYYTYILVGLCKFIPFTCAHNNFHLLH